MNSLLHSFVLVGAACLSADATNDNDSSPKPILVDPRSSVATSAGACEAADKGPLRTATDTGWLEYVVDVPKGGRFHSTVVARTLDVKPVKVWIEDYVGNPDGRTYDITGPMVLKPGGEAPVELGRAGSPLDAGEHRIRVHFDGGRIELSSIRFHQLKAQVATPTTLVQRTEGDEWKLVWSDEFEGEGLPDSAKWTSDVGNWGWGNKEPQYYTEGRLENARREGGSLIIEARKNDLGRPWTSARLTTRGKVSFLYGRVEIRAQVPVGDGAWAAGWLLGDDYRDEVSWPYCGEVDILEGVGREIDDLTGDGLNHASCHTRAYYFKQGNHISNTRQVAGMGKGFHTYSMEWTPEAIQIFVDGEHYYTYDKRANDLEWPFNRPQNLILNLAMGGGMGGAIDPSLESQKFVIDYVRVFGRQ